MILRKFNWYECYLNFDIDSGEVIEIASELSGMKVVGEGAFVGENFVAMYVENGGLFLWISGRSFDLEDPNCRCEYKNIDGGRTNFNVFDSKCGAEISYESWWIDYPEISPGEGVAENFEEDFCAYVVYVLSDSEVVDYYKNRF